MIFLTVAMDSNGALGAGALDTFMKGFAAKREHAMTDKEKWAIINEQQGLFASMCAIVHRRNYAILVAQASPIGGGFMPAAPDVSEVRDAEQMHMM